MRLSAHDGPYGEKPLVKEYANTNQRVVQVFFAKHSLPGDGLVQQHGHDAADDGADHGNRSVAPVGAALTLDGQNGVGDAGADVTGRVQGVTGQAAERHADGGDDAEHQEVALRAVQAARPAPYP